MITANRTAEIFQALKLHYESPKYDYFKYNGRLRTQPKNPDKKFNGLALRLLTQDKVENFFAANIIEKFIKNNSIPNYVGEYYNKQAIQTLQKWQLFHDDQSIAFIEYIKSKTRLKTILFKGENMPLLYNDIYDGKVTIDIAANLLYHYPSIESKWDQYKDDPLYNSLHGVVMKHKNFIENKSFICQNLKKILENIDK